LRGEQVCVSGGVAWLGMFPRHDSYACVLEAI